MNTKASSERQPDPLETALSASKPLPASNIEECRELLEIERLVPPHKAAGTDHFREPDSETIRQRCIRRIVAHVGEAGLKEFLRQPQPALGNRTGGELLQSQPEELLRRLDDLDRIEAAANPIVDRAPQVRSRGKTNRVLSILDQLDRENSNRRWKA